jgi:hypothetical protein
VGAETTAATPLVEIGLFTLRLVEGLVGRAALLTAPATVAQEVVVDLGIIVDAKALDRRG